MPSSQARGGPEPEAASSGSFVISVVIVVSLVLFVCIFYPLLAPALFVVVLLVENRLFHLMHSRGQCFLDDNVREITVPTCVSGRLYNTVYRGDSFSFRAHSCPGDYQTHFNRLLMRGTVVYFCSLLAIV